MSSPRIPPTLADYVAALMEWQAYADRLWTGPREDYRVTVNNRLAKRAETLLRALRSRADWPAVLETMASNKEPLVRMMAAHELHDREPERALRMYAEIEHGPYGRLSDSARWAARGRAFGSHRAAAGVEPMPAHPADFDSERVALAEAVLKVHGATMNGGFLDAFDSAGDSLPDAIRGYEQIGLEAVARLLRDGIALFPNAVVPVDPIERQRLVDRVVDADALEALGESYETLVPSDDLLGELLDAFLDMPRGG